MPGCLRQEYQTRNNFLDITTAKYRPVEILVRDNCTGLLLLIDLHGLNFINFPQKSHLTRLRATYLTILFDIHKVGVQIDVINHWGILVFQIASNKTLSSSRGGSQQLLVATASSQLAVLFQYVANTINDSH